MPYQSTKFLKNMSHKHDSSLHIAMYPWLSMSHITAFIRISNKLAERGHKISLFLPPKTQLRIASQNRYPELITFITVALPPVDGFPVGAETTNDIPEEARPLLMTAIDLTKDTIETHLVNLKPDIVFYNFIYWLPQLARKLGIKSIYYMSGFIVRFAHLLHVKVTPSVVNHNAISSIPSFPPPSKTPRPHDGPSQAVGSKVHFGGGMTFVDLLAKTILDCDAIGFKTSKEMEQDYCEFIENNYGKPVFAAGPVVPGLVSGKLDDQFGKWLSGFEPGEVVYCALGSECTLELSPFQELVVGLELTGRPFLAALKPPKGCETIKSGLPEGFSERTKGRGIVHGGWVQQQLILQHPSIGCFVTHCGESSLSEAMVNTCQIVMIPLAVDQFTNAWMMSSRLKVGVEVATRDEDGFFTRETVRKAVEFVMDEESEVGKEVRANHAKWKEFILKEGVEESYISSFIENLYELLC